MSSLKTIAALVALTLLVGCKGDFKTCNDSEAKKTVLKIISENTFKSVEEYLKNALQPIVAEAELIDIKTTDSNDKLGAYNCSANYTVKYDDKQHSTPVTYNLSHLEDSNTTDVRVHLGEVPNLVSNILEYLDRKSKKLIADYETKRGGSFTGETQACMRGFLIDYNNKYGNHMFTANNLAEWDKTCTAKVATTPVTTAK